MYQQDGSANAIFQLGDTGWHPRSGKELKRAIMAIDIGGCYGLNSLAIRKASPSTSPKREDSGPNSRQRAS